MYLKVRSKCNYEIKILRLSKELQNWEIVKNVVRTYWPGKIINLINNY